MNDKQRLALVKDAKKHLKLTAKGWIEKPVGGGTEWQAAMESLNKLEKDLAAKPGWANIGPITKPGASLLDMSLTHKTEGIPLYPAVDLAWGAGVPMYAPEACTVFLKDTSASPGEALYLKGASGLLYWWGHLDRDHPLGKKFTKGALIAKTVNQPPGMTDHGHVGVNAEKYLGSGKQLKYGRTGNGPDYTTGSPRIRVQLQESEV
jgi:hypothetical protein